MLIAPTEPPALKAIGTSSSTPERYGVDVLFATKQFGAVGIQRKEVNDLVASCNDGRLRREFAQMKSLGLAMLLIEGSMSWSSDGLLISRSRFTVQQYRGLIWKANSQGIWTASTSNLTDTISFVSMFGEWMKKERHATLSSRPGPRSEWGTVDNRDWGMHILQGFDGMGSERAAILYDRYGVPLIWTVTKKEMSSLPKFGKVTVDRLFAALRQVEV